MLQAQPPRHTKQGSHNHKTPASPTQPCIRIPAHTSLPVPTPRGLQLPSPAESNQGTATQCSVNPQPPPTVLCTPQPAWRSAKSRMPDTRSACASSARMQRLQTEASEPQLPTPPQRGRTAVPDRPIGRPALLSTHCNRTSPGPKPHTQQQTHGGCSDICYEAPWKHPASS